MQANQFKALLNQGITEFGISPTPITHSLPSHIPATVKSIKTDCPLGLTQATVIEDGHKWVEKYTFGCGGDQEHEVERRNGVLVEFDLYPVDPQTLRNAEHSAYEKLTSDDEKKKFLLRGAANRWIKTDHATVFVPDGKPTERRVRLVVSRKAIVVPWAEYAMVQAERDKYQAERDERHARFDVVADQLRIPRPGESKRKRGWYRWQYREEFFTNGKEKSDKNFNKILEETADEVAMVTRWRDSNKAKAGLYVNYEMPMPHAKKIASVLEAVRAGDLEAAVRFVHDLDQAQEG